MNGISIPEWAGWLLAGIAALGMTALAIYTARLVWLSRIFWTDLAKPLQISGVSYRTINGAKVDERLLAEAVDRAFLCLAMRGPWETMQLRDALKWIRIEITSVEAWKTMTCDSAGNCHVGNVAGQTDLERRVITVGQSLAALAHEMAHLAELRLDQKIDYMHEGWASRGIQSAVDTYAPAPPI